MWEPILPASFNHMGENNSPRQIFFSHKKTELKFSCFDKKSRWGSKIHNHICGSIIAASRCHISICPESGKEWSKLSRGNHCIGRINIDQPSDRGCSWDFEAPWLCCWHLSHPECCPCEDAAGWRTEMQISHLSSPPISLLCQYPSISHTSSKCVLCWQAKNLCMPKINMGKCHVFLTSNTHGVAAMGEPGKLLFKSPLNCWSENS